MRKIMDNTQEMGKSIQENGFPLMTDNGLYTIITSEPFNQE